MGVHGGIWNQKKIIVDMIFGIDYHGLSTWC